MADNSSRKFKFISPGVFVNEIDNSQLPQLPNPIGPLVIGRSSRGPGMKPVTVSSFNEFVETFGNPVPGGSGDDVWRLGNFTSTMYGPYAAQAWLVNNPTVTYVRLLGEQDPDATDAGKAGWRAGSATKSINLTNGGAFGLLVFPSASLHLTTSAAVGTSTPVTGALAAVLYAESGHFFLSGTRTDGQTTGSACELYEFSNGNIKLGMQKDATSEINTVTVSLDPNRPNFIRKVLNTNPTIVNDAITSQGTMTSSFGGKFWVGESFENSLTEAGTASTGVLVGSGSANVDIQNGKLHAAIVALVNQKTTTEDQNDFRFAATKATTGWFIAQDLSEDTASYAPATQQRLFRLEALSAGEGTQREVKVSIANIKAPRGDFEEYGTFSVLVRRLSDNDNAPQILERFDNLNLNPASPNFIAAQIGTKYEAYDAQIKGNRQYGSFANKSDYVRVVLNEELERGALDSRFLPFGVFGPLKYRDLAYSSGSAGFNAKGTYASIARSSVQSMAYGTSSAGLGNPGGFPKGGTGNAGLDSTLDASIRAVGAGGAAASNFRATIINPSVPLRSLSSWGEPKDNRNVYWGAWSGKSATNTAVNPGLNDMLRVRNASFSSANTNPAGIDHDIASLDQVGRLASDPLQIAWVFSLDDVSGSFISGSSIASSGSYAVNNRVNGESISATSAYTGTLAAGYDRFTTMLHGGSDGFNITERDPFRLGSFSGASNEKASYQLHSLKRAINIISDPEEAQYNVVTIPGVTQNTVTRYLLDTVEDRGDALALIDIQNVYQPDSENANSEQDRNNFTIKQAVDGLLDRGINNSYGATYYPWLMIRDTVNERNIWMPPSVAALGALSTTDRVQAPWFAPAGFARGGLSEGAGGLPVMDVSRRLTSDDRDSLYEAGINPIAKFPAEGIVIFGQKTLQQTRSALDRINVRRLLIYLKREISFIASRLLFAPNRSETWSRFTAQAAPLLNDVKAQFGIDDFRLILDESTTTPDLIDRNIVYAKLLIKPTRAIEYFAIDFVVTNSGASFED